MGAQLAHIGLNILKHLLGFLELRKRIIHNDIDWRLCRLIGGEATRNQVLRLH